MGWLANLRNRIAEIVRADDGSGPVAPSDSIDRDLHTLDHWRNKLSGFPRTIECSKFELLGNDCLEPYFVGPGRIEILSETDMRFFVYADAPDPTSAFRKRIKAKEHPYEATDQFQVHATDYEGVAWACGWAAVEEFADAKHGWPLTGEISSLTTLADGFWVASRPSVELLLIPPVDLPMTKSIVTESRIGDDKVHSTREAGQHSVTALGTTITFTYERGGKALWITADTSDQFKHPYAENWLTEPLRILLGIPVYPRMVARNMGDGTAHVWLRPSPRKDNLSAIGLLLPFAIDASRREAFWQLYVDLLTMIAKSGLFEAHPITHLYDELAQAAEGSRWVITLTLASSVESLASQLMTDTDRRSEFSDEMLTSMKTHLRSWKNDIKLRDRLLNNLGLVSKKSVLAFMRGLGAQGIVNPAHVQTWSEIRNAVMHGEMVEPWSSEEGDRKMQDLLTLVHALTRALVAKGTWSA
jgi:hypothetical protein